MKRTSASWRKIAAAGVLCAALGLVGPAAEAAGIFTNGVCTAGSTGTSTGSPAVTYCNNPNTLPLTGIEQIPADTELSGGQSPQSEAITIGQLGAYNVALPSRGNLLAGGDASTNTFVHGTTGSSVTTTATYGGPTDWFYWSGASTAMTVSQDSTAADLPTGYQDAFKMARTSAQTGEVQMCFAQEVESQVAYQMQGTIAEVDFHARAGANFSPTNSNLMVYLVYGTGTDEGSQKMAFGLNAGGGGSTGWTGQANATAAVIPISTTVGRYAAVATVPSTAKEVGVAICYTPANASAGTNDYVALSGIQLVRNTANAGAVNATAGYACTAIQCASFERKQVTTDVAYQQRYAWSIVEGGAASHPLQQIPGSSATTTTCSVVINNPVTMRAAPTYTNALSATTFKFLPYAGTAVVLSTPFSAETDTTTGNSANVDQLTFTASTVTQTAGWGCALEGIGGTGALVFSAEL